MRTARLHESGRAPLDDPNSDDDIGIPAEDCPVTDMGAYEFPAEQEIAVGVGPKHLRITPPSGSEEIALKVIGDCTNSEIACVEVYVQEPFEVEFAYSAANFQSAALDASPVYKTPASWGTVYVMDEEIRPLSAYTVQAVDTEEVVISETTSSAATWAFGDVDNSGLVELNDVNCILEGFGICWVDGSCPSNCEPMFHAYDTDATLCENPLDSIWFDIDIGDVGAVLSAYSGGSYTCTPPCAARSSMAAKGRDGQTVEASATLVALEATMLASETAAVDIFLTDAGVIRAYQFAVEVTGPNGQPIENVLLSVDQGREDFAMLDRAVVTGNDRLHSRIVVGSRDEAVEANGNVYIGTVRFSAGPRLRESGDACR